MNAATSHIEHASEHIRDYYERPSREHSMVTIACCVFSIIGGATAWIIGIGIEKLIGLTGLEIDWISQTLLFVGVLVGAYVFCLRRAASPPFERKEV